ncbi:hypothetical protein CPB84DRAFT_1248753 [Gymnopilus junonius]|uniref:Uncharacterized protein n=1 Tax=Gymnopilus junonius TaxID=109634 RepID=A0A9P5TLZ3_GYMJU|nr:hypothetical protein CPB84DRAFT_1248753 [Gymnopilus junonius]
MPSFHPPPHTPISPFFPPPNFGTAQVPYTTYRPICYEKGLIKIDIRVDPSGQVFPDLPTMSKLVNVDYPQAPIRVSLWNWAPSASAAEMYLRSGVVHVLSGHFKFVFGLLWRWHSARLDLKLIEALVMHICGGDSRKIPIGGGPGILESVKFTRAGDIKDVQLVDTFLSRLSGQQMHELCIGVSDSAKPFSILRTFRSIHYAFLTRLELDGFAVSAFQVHELLIETLNIMECVVSDLTGPFQELARP